MVKLNYRHLFYFYTIAKKGSIAGASKELLLAQPTLSMQLQNLEKAINRKLFERQGRKLLLTDEGAIVLRYAEAIFQLGRELEYDLHDRPMPGARLARLGIASGLPKSFSHAMLRCILERNPNAQIFCEEAALDQLLPKLRDFRLDIVLSDVCVSAGPQGRFSSHQVGKSPILFVAKPALAKRFPRLPAALNDAPMILPQAPSNLYKQLQVYFSDNKVKPRIVAEVQDVEIARQLAISGLGIAPLCAYTHSVSRPGKALAIVGPGQSTGLFQTLYFVTLEDRLRLNPLAKMLLERCRLPRVTHPI